MSRCREPETLPGSYLLLFQLSRPVTITVGGGEHRFIPGYYLYCGSALGPGGVAARVRHHRHISFRPHWHLDYLRPHLTLLEVWFSYGDRLLEHLWSQHLVALRGASMPHPGFGSSDCDCRSHLTLLGYKPSFAGFSRRVIAAVPDHARICRMIVSEA